MTKVASGYERKDLELYETPGWCAQALAEVIPLKDLVIWEPAVGPGKLARAMKDLGATVIGTDIKDYGSDDQSGIYDFAGDDPVPEAARRIHAIVTNPPYGKGNRLAEVFARKALNRIPTGGFVALLMPSTFDHGKTRADLFGSCPHFAGSIRLTKRIQWFDGDAGNTENHQWLIWRRDALRRRVESAIWYAPRTA